MKLKIPPPIQGLFWALCMWLMAKFTTSFDLYHSIQKPIGVVVIGLGLSIDVISVILFIKARTTINPLSPQQTSKLVTNGLYSISRNPMYLGMALILFGWMIILGNPINIIFFICFILGINKIQIIPEEVILKQIFGEEYTAYQKSVRRWI